MRRLRFLLASAAIVLLGGAACHLALEGEYVRHGRHILRAEHPVDYWIHVGMLGAGLPLLGLMLYALARDVRDVPKQNALIDRQRERRDLERVPQVASLDPTRPPSQEG